MRRRHADGETNGDHPVLRCGMPGWHVATGRGSGRRGVESDGLAPPISVALRSGGPEGNPVSFTKGTHGIRHPLHFGRP
jgi:hypothetical protein